MNNHNETVQDIMQKEPKEIKQWLSELIDKEIEYKEKLIDFNILLLEECVKTMFSKTEDKDIAIEWLELNLFILSILKDIYTLKSSYSYDADMMQIRINLINKFADDEELKMENLAIITNWINLEAITFDQLKQLHDRFIETKDKEALNKYFEIRMKVFTVKRLIDDKIIEPNEKMNALIYYIISCIFFKQD